MSLLALLFVLSCQQDEKVLSLEEQFFGNHEIKVMNDFLKQMDDAVCADAADEDFNCFNDFLCQKYNAGGEWGRMGFDLVQKMEPKEFSALFVFSKGFRQKGHNQPRVPWEYLHVNENLSAFVKAYYETTEKELLKFLMERSSWFTNFGPSAQAHFLMNCADFDFSNDRDRLLYYLAYVLNSYNATSDI